MRMDALRAPKGNEARCPTCGGAVHRRPFGEMHAGSYVLDGRRVEIRREPSDGYADPIVLDALTQYFNGGLYRMWPSETYLSRGGHKIHRDVWIAAFGPVPKGCHIHHRDGNVLNNAVGNLECLPGSEHLSRTWRSGAKAKLASSEHFTDAARAKAAEWHRSDAGRLWHSRHAKSSAAWTKWRRETKNCEHCGKPFDALVRKNAHAHIYCTATCKAAAYRLRRVAARNG